MNEDHTIAACDLIPLKQVRDNFGLNVPQQLSQPTAIRLVDYGWVTWEPRGQTPKRRSMRGVVHLTDAGRAVLASH